MRQKTRVDHIEDANKAHTDLNTFAAIQALCESSLFTADSFGGEARIGRICITEMDKCLRRYDRAMALATKETPDRKAVELDNVVTVALTEVGL